ncbi:MAG: PIN domain-containing protein [Terracidiphilus sp.]
MAGELVLVDSNVLIRWLQPRDPAFPAIEASITQFARSGAVLCYTSQNLGEFWNVLTRPADRNGYGLTPEEADRQARQVEARFRLLPDSLAVHEEWRKLLAAVGVSGVQVHDARLVAAMRVHGVRRVLTLNKSDFARFDGIEAVHPDDVLRAS